MKRISEQSIKMSMSRMSDEFKTESSPFKQQIVKLDDTTSSSLIDLTYQCIQIQQQPGTRSIAQKGFQKMMFGTTDYPVKQEYR